MRKVTTSDGAIRAGLDIKLMERFHPGMDTELTAEVSISSRGINVKGLQKDIRSLEVYLSRDRTRMALRASPEGWELAAKGRSPDRTHIYCKAVIRKLEAAGIAIPQKTRAVWDEEAGIWEARLKKAGPQPEPRT